jgi:hypothetical protein
MEREDWKNDGGRLEKNGDLESQDVYDVNRRTVRLVVALFPLV